MTIRAFRYDGAALVIDNVRGALPDGENCTDEEALAFLEAEGAKLGEASPWGDERPEQMRAADTYDAEREPSR